MSEILSLFSSLKENVDLALHQVRDKDVQRKENEAFVAQEFWMKLDGAVKQVSQEATKLCLSFSQPPLPDLENARLLAERIERAVLVLLSAYYGLPRTQGMHLYESTRQSVLDILEALQKLILLIAEDSKAGSLTQQQSTGGIWEQCDSFMTSPRDNKEAVAAVAKQTAALVSDALTELEEAQDAADDDDLDEDINDLEDDINLDKWTAADKILLAPCTGLIKAAKSSLKKVSSAIRTNGLSDSKENIDSLDVAGNKIKGLSPAVDDFALTLYPPINRDAVQEEGEKLHLALQHLLQFSKTSHFVTENDMKWVEFLTKAVDHNWQKIQTVSLNS